MSELIRREDAIKATWKEPSYADPLNVLTEVRDRINAIPAAPRWHRVEERLPNVGELVVGLDADGHAEITMLSEAKCWLTYGLWIHNLGCYVWWMPLPEPPKEDE